VHERVPARETVALGEIAAALVERDAADARDPLGAALVVRLLRLERELD